MEKNLCWDLCQIEPIRWANCAHIFSNASRLRRTTYFCSQWWQPRLYHYIYAVMEYKYGWYCLVYGECIGVGFKNLYSGSYLHTWKLPRASLSVISADHWLHKFKEKKTIEKKDRWQIIWVLEQSKNLRIWKWYWRRCNHILYIYTLHHISKCCSVMK